MKARNCGALGNERPWVIGHTWLESEGFCKHQRDFSRRALVWHSQFDKLVECRATIPDTYFSVPATTELQHGYIRVSSDGDRLVFYPHNDQTLPPAAWRKQYRKDCK